MCSFACVQYVSGLTAIEHFLYLLLFHLSFFIVCTFNFSLPNNITLSLFLFLYNLSPPCVLILPPLALLSFFLSRVVGRYNSRCLVVVIELTFCMMDALLTPLSSFDVFRLLSPNGTFPPPPPPVGISGLKQTWPRPSSLAFPSCQSWTKSLFYLAAL